MSAPRKPTAEAVAAVLLERISITGQADWSQLSEAIREEFVIKNWLTKVRGPLQSLMNSGRVERTFDTPLGVRGPEMYALTKSATPGDQK